MLGFCHNAIIDRLYGSDIDPRMVAHARKNAALLTRNGMMARRAEIERMIEMYGKPSHRAALQSAFALENRLTKELPIEIFEADCTQPLPEIAPESLSPIFPTAIWWVGAAMRLLR